MGQIGFPETSVRNYHYSLHNSPEQRSSKVQETWGDFGENVKFQMLSRMERHSTNEWWDLLGDMLKNAIARTQVICHVSEIQLSTSN